MVLVCLTPTFQVKREIIATTTHVADIDEKTGSCTILSKPADYLPRDSSLVVLIFGLPDVRQCSVLSKIPVQGGRKQESRWVLYGNSGWAIVCPLNLRCYVS